MTDEHHMLVRGFLDGDLPPEREPEALRRIADETEARALLRFEMQVRDTWTADPVDIPSGFAGRTMAAIEAAEEEVTDSVVGLDQVAERVWHWLVAPFAVRVRPVAVVAVALVVVAAVSLWPATRPEATEPVAATASPPVTTAAEHREVVWTRFMYVNDEAASVAVAGDFSGWEPIPLSATTTDGRTVWTGVVPVSKGEHQYMFVIDGSRWVTDPLAPVQRSDGFGNQNAVIQL